jgi:hypothetical protein
MVIKKNAKKSMLEIDQLGVPYTLFINYVVEKAATVDRKRLLIKIGEYHTKFKEGDTELFTVRINQWAAKGSQQTKDTDFGNGWKAQVTVGIDGNTLQYRFKKA